ncbi:uncharacterized protein OCT59_015734 [Rhizophagus irregularis]|uniref:uncharacterized protein n=1 Tax=Rhizophagus irregularis TaxID=588596 RepID=UPI00331C5216|nr:hypothetical protein OCT59_015734 [Rhizophagus irregularis]
MSEFILPSLDANISRFTDPFSIILGSLESPCSGLYRRKKSSLIESLDPEIFTFKVEALRKALDLLRYKILIYIFFNTHPQFTVYYIVFCITRKWKPL